MARSLTLHHGKAFGQFPWAQIESYCGQLTPLFVSKEAGRRHLKIGTEDQEWSPWKKEWTRPVAEWIEYSDLPETYAEFAAQVHDLAVNSSGATRLLKMPPKLGQYLGMIIVNGVIPHLTPVVTIGTAFPLVQRVCDLGKISHAEAAALIKLMVADGITEGFTDEFANDLRGTEPRFAWETYFTEDVIRTMP